MESIVEVRARVEHAVGHVLAWADRGEPCSFTAFERECWSLLLALGRALVLLFLARQAARPRPALYTHEGRDWVVRGCASSPLGTRFGKVRFARPIGRPARSRVSSRCDLPVDRELGLRGGFSLGVVLLIAKLCAQGTFGAARSMFRDAHEWAPAPRGVLRMVDAVGARARAFLEEAPAPADDGEVLVVQVDARGAPMIGHAELARRRRPHRRRPRNGTQRHWRRSQRREFPRKRRTKGKKSKNAKMAVVGAVYTLRRTAQGYEGPIHKRLIATFESHLALFQWLRREADKRGYGRKRTLFLADGCPHIWHLQPRFFPEAEVCLDWCHVVEKLWEAGGCLHAEGSAALEAWVDQQRSRLRRGDIAALLRELQRGLDSIARTGPGTKGKRDRLAHVLGYLTGHRERLRYRELRSDDLDIGTGVIEGAVRNLVAIRHDGPGMHWGRARAEYILLLRCIFLNGQWDDFAAAIERAGALRLPAKPEAAIPHAAVKKAA